MRDALRRALVLTLICIASVAGAADAPDYRLAGIVAVGDNRFLAVIEMPDGRQGLFRAGDSLDSARISAISRSEVRMEVEGREVSLSLRGNPRLSAAAPIVEDVPVTPDEPGGNPEARNQPLFYEDTARLLTSIARTNGGTTATTRPAYAGAPQTGAAAEALSARLGEVLGLPAGARVVAVDGAPVNSPQEVIDKVLPLLELRRAVRLNLTGAGDLKVIYLTGVEEE